ncbi:MAG: hypothetical protein K6T63_01085 [Alicyclobacillus herbarius]|uniref:hypothetical protein n=1 Tax=Alicyclobacillus herbarius TaxID=122960 RepID=UPI0023520F8A|nr:hypothetical protein [Alicyclobacillus herbarius]MCL6631200.1 hypothetical protein [Alicyclobacillus herbarius]
MGKSWRRCISVLVAGVALMLSGCAGLWGSGSYSGEGHSGSHTTPSSNGTSTGQGQNSTGDVGQTSNATSSKDQGAIGNGTSGHSSAGGTGTSGTGTQGSTQGGLSTGSQPTDAFPKIIRMAMDGLSPATKDGAWAPAVFPVSANGSTTLFYHDIETAGPVNGRPGLLHAYTVQLSSPQGRLAAFGGGRYDSLSEAEQGLWNDWGDARRVPGEVSSIALGSGLAGKAAVDPDRRIGRVGWSEGRWQILVTRENTTAAPTDTAAQVVALLNQYFLPVPKDTGEILVHQQRQETDVTVAWLRRNLLFDVQTYSVCRQPLATAIRMAAAMKPYTG